MCERAAAKRRIRMVTSQGIVEVSAVDEYQQDVTYRLQCAVHQPFDVVRRCSVPPTVYLRQVLADGVGSWERWSPMTGAQLDGPTRPLRAEASRLAQRAIAVHAVDAYFDVEKYGKLD